MIGERRVVSAQGLQGIMLTLKATVREHPATPKRPKASRLSVIFTVSGVSPYRAKPAIDLISVEHAGSKRLPSVWPS
jgi:hypothetical protein